MHDDNHLNAKRVKMNQGGHIYEKKSANHDGHAFFQSVKIEGGKVDSK